MLSCDARKMKKMSKDQEKKLYAILDRVVAAVDSGVHPNEAITKEAKSNSLLPEQVKLLVYAFNNGKQLATLTTGKTREEKAASCEIADLKVILENIFPSEIKSATDEAMSEIVSEDYSVPPHVLGIGSNRRYGCSSAVIEERKKEIIEKQANKLDPAISRLMPILNRGIEFTIPVKDSNFANKELYKIASSAKSNLSNAKMKLMEIKDEISKKIDEIDMELKKPSNIKILPDLFKVAEDLFGSVASAIKDEMISRDKSRHFIIKSAEKEGRKRKICLIDADSDVFKLIEKCSHLVEDYERLKQEVKAKEIDYNKAVEAVRAVEKELISEVTPAMRAKRAAEYTVKPYIEEADRIKMVNSICDLVSESSKFLMKNAGKKDGKIEKLARNGNSDDEKETEEMEITVRPNRRRRGTRGEDHSRSLDDKLPKKFKIKIRDLNLMTNIMDILWSDEFIRGVNNPEEVIRAVNEILSISPKLGASPAVLKAFVRKRLSQGFFDPFDIAQMVNASAGMRTKPIYSIGMEQTPTMPRPPVH